MVNYLNSKHFKLHQFLNQRSYCRLEYSLHELKSEFLSTNSMVLHDLAEAAYRLCRACRDMRSRHDGDKYAQEFKWQQDMLHEQLGVLLTSLQALSASQGIDAPPAINPCTQSDMPKGMPSAMTRCCRWLRRRFTKPPAGLNHGRPGWMPMEVPISAPDSNTDPPLTHQPDRQPSSTAVHAGTAAHIGSHSMQVYTIGPFRACVDGIFVRDWHNAKSRKIFQYLAFHHDHAVLKERLMELFWPDSTPDAARNSLNVAVYGLRKVLRQADPNFSYIIYQNTSYCINPKVEFWLDCDDFLKCYERFELCKKERNEQEMMNISMKTVSIFEGTTQENEIQEEWIFSQQQHMKEKYIIMTKFIIDYYFKKNEYDKIIDFSNKIITIDPYDEEVHRNLMTCYCRSGRAHLALRQYNRCFESLNKDLAISPSSLTTELFHQIRQRSIT